MSINRCFSSEDIFCILLMIIDFIYKLINMKNLFVENIDIVYQD